MRYLTLAEVLDLHRRVIEQSGGADGVHVLGSVESAVAQPQMSFGGEELYPTIESKATALCFVARFVHGGDGCSTLLGEQLKTMATQPKILAFSGSLRKDSFNDKLVPFHVHGGSMIRTEANAC